MTGAIAHPNIALVKYFGKRNPLLNLPAAGSLSITLLPFRTKTFLSCHQELFRDEITINGKPADESFSKKVIRFLDIVRKISGKKKYVKISTDNNFPTSAGLASSASGFAALTVALVNAFDMKMDERQKSALARQGSGSAARSITGGICVMKKGERDDGLDSYAQTILEPDEWDVRVVAGIVDEKPKEINSTFAMEHTKKTSPYYSSWIESCELDLREAIDAVKKRDFTKLGEITERSALSMHAACLAARPAIVYFMGPTIEALNAVKKMRKNGIEVYFTLDAGPQPKFLCTSKDEKTVEEIVQSIKGIKKTILCRPGPGAYLT